MASPKRPSQQSRKKMGSAQPRSTPQRRESPPVRSSDLRSTTVLWSSKFSQEKGGAQTHGDVGTHQLRLTNRTSNRPAKVGKSMSLSGMVGAKWRLISGVV